MRSTIVGMFLTGMLAALLFLVSTPPAPAGPVPVNDEPLAVRVREAIEKGMGFLRRQQKDGKWQDDNLLFANRRYQSGVVSLALLALLTCGAPNDDQAVKEGLKFIRDVRPNMTGDRRIAASDTSLTYSVSLQTMVYGLAGHDEDKERIQENVDWLLAARIPNSGWTYGKADGGEYDASNTQYALLALHEGVRAGAKVDPKALEEIQKFYRDSQLKDGSWAYAPGINPSMTMTTAGLCGLLITGMDREEGHRALDKNGVDPNCGDYEENPKVAKAVQWIADRFPADPPNAEAAAKYFQTISGQQIQFAAPFYGLYGLERTGRLTGQRFLGGHDWYRVGCQCLVNSQKDDGRWEGGGRGIDGNPLVATCFALLFLGKGRTPVLMTKFAYGQKDYEGWNNKHNDMRNVVEFAGRELFKKQPMAWQIFDIREKGAENDKAIHDLTEQLLESPLVFFNGHDQAPDGNKKDLLKQYLENGGFVFAEACCGKDGRGAGFDKDFRRLVSDLYPDAQLRPLPPEHPIYRASGKFVSLPGDFPLEGIELGCKTLLVYSPNAISGYWEANDTTSDKGKKAFELAANVIAYATGLEAPRQKLDSVAIAGKEPPSVKRGYLETAQLRYNGDWHPAPRAMHNLMTEARGVGLDVALDSRATDDGIDPGDANIVRYRFLYMHGRGKFSYKPTELDNLRFDLEENGGLLLADACCGNKDFDASFRKFMEDFPWKDSKDKPKLEPIPPDDELFSEELNGKKIDKVMCRRETPDGKGVDTEFRSVTPALEGIKINGRWVVIYSRYDIGCALERHPTPGCLGHDFDSAAALGKAAVLYALKR